MNTSHVSTVRRSPAVIADALSLRKDYGPSAGAAEPAS